jgi:maltooligosyltrehalose trehalohydrolase
MTAFGAYPLRHGPALHDDGTITFRVWAPYRQQVDLIRDGHEPVAMTPRPHGWHSTRVPGGAGDRYAFSLDGGDPRPDPATQRQPDGVHAPGEVVDRAAFRWSDGESRWRPPQLSSAVIYELHIGTFTPEGTFDAAVAHLAGLRHVGVTHIEVMPVAAFNGPHGWGYDGVCWYAVHEPYGGPHAFARFVDACHRADLAVILDVVYNHFGPSGSYHGEFGPYLTDRYSTPWGSAINFDHDGADAVRAFVVDNALMWLADFHVDGLRLDAVHALHDGTATPILRELSTAVDRLSEQVGRPLALIAESDQGDPRTVLPRPAGGMGLAAQWLDDLHHAIHVTVTGERDAYYADYEGLPEVVAAYARGFVFDGRWSDYRQRTVGTPLPDGVSGRRLVACIQNHDQVGNRAFGRRLTVLADDDRVRFAIGLLGVAPTVPMLFMGDEYGATTPFLYFSSHPEPELAEAIRAGRRAEFSAFTAFKGDEVPDPQDPEVLARSTLDRQAAGTPAAQARRRLWRDVLRLRRTAPALATGDRRMVRPLHTGSHQMAVLRDDPAGAAPLVIVANAGDDPAGVTFTLPGTWRTRWACTDPVYGGHGTPVGLEHGDEGVRCSMPPWCVAVLERT